MESVREDAKLVQQVLDSFLYYDREELLNKAAERQGMEKGLKEGMEQGEKQKAMDVAKKMFKIENITLDQIEEVTGLSKEELHEIL